MPIGSISVRVNNSVTMTIFADRVKAHAKELDTNPSEIARKLSPDAALGSAERWFYNFVREHNPREPKASLIIKTAEVLETTPNYLLGSDKEPTPSTIDRQLIREAIQHALVQAQFAAADPQPEDLAELACGFYHIRKRPDQ